MSYDIYHSITQIPTFITKSGLNLINNYPDRFALDHHWTSDGSVESYCIDPYFGESLDSFYELDDDRHSLDINDSLEEEKRNEMNNQSSHPSDSHTFTIDNSIHHNHESLKKSVSSAVSVDFPKYSSLSRLHFRHRYCSCYFSNSNSSLASNDSSFYSSSSSSSGLDPSSDPDTQKTYSIIKKIKKLILLGRNNSHISVEDDIKRNIIRNENNKSNNDKDNNNKTIYVSNSNINPSAMGDNTKGKKEFNMDLTAIPHSSNENNSNRNQKLNSKMDTLEPKLTNLPVKKKDNIYDINTLTNSKYSFLHQKDQFLKTFICSPVSGSHITNDNHGYDLVEEVSDNDNDTELLNITSEEINYLKDHPPHFHSCYCGSHNHNHKHHYPSSNYIHSHYGHIQKESFNQENNFYHPHGDSENSNSPLCSNFSYNKNLDNVKSNSDYIDQQSNKEHVSIEPGMINDSNTLLNPRENCDYPNFEKNNNLNINSFSSSPSPLNNNDNIITNTTTINSDNKNKNNDKNNNLSAPISPSSRMNPITFNDSYHSPISLSKSLDMSSSSKDQNHSSGPKIISQEKEINQKNGNKNERKKEKEGNNIIKHIKNCSCNICLEKKNILQSRDSNKIPLYKKKHSQTKRHKYNIFDTLFYENNNNIINNKIKNNNNNNNKSYNQS